MCTVTIRLNPAFRFMEGDIAEAIRSVLGDEETDWGVSVLSEAATDNWNVGAQPGDGEPFHGVLNDNQHSADAVRHLMFSFLQQYKDWLRDEEE